MSRTGWRSRWAAVAMAGVVTAAAMSGAGPGAAASAAPASGPQVKLIAAQNSITVPRYGGQVYLDPGIWVASLGSAFQLDVQRPDYATPLTVTQVVHLPGGGTQRIPWPASVVGTIPAALKDFVSLTVRNSARQGGGLAPHWSSARTATTRSGLARTAPPPRRTRRNASAIRSRSHWSGAWRGAGPSTRPSRPSGPCKLALGHYTVTETITPTYAQLLNISAADASATRAR